MKVLDWILISKQVSNSNKTKSFLRIYLSVENINKSGSKIAGADGDLGGANEVTLPGEHGLYLVSIIDSGFLSGVTGRRFCPFGPIQTNQTYSSSSLACFPSTESDFIVTITIGQSEQVAHDASSSVTSVR